MASVAERTASVAERKRAKGMSNCTNRVCRELYREADFK